jgi:FKBP-type peptidyl-prolyl cis-trans isomerase SlyD
MQKGDIVRWEYEGWTLGPKPEKNELFETTNESLAKNNNIFKEGAVWGPAPLIVGAERLVKGLESSVLAAEMGKEVEVTIPPSDAYGDRDPKKVEIHSLGEVLRLPEYRKGEDEPAPGKHIVLGNKAGTIMTVRGGRVRIDFNHDLAGKTLKYKYVLRTKAETPLEKVQAVFEMHYGRPGDFKFQVHDDRAEITVMEQCKYDPQWMLTKLQVVSDLREYAGMTRIQLIEEYIKPADKAPPSAVPAAPDAAAVGTPAEMAPQKSTEPAKMEEPAKQ